MGSLSLRRLSLLTLEAVAWMGFCWGLMRLFLRTSTLPILLLLLAGIIFLRFTYLGLINFSGAGFTNEFFIHLEWQSLVIAWQEYPYITLSGCLTILALLILSYSLCRHLLRPSLIASLILVITCGSLIGLRYSHTPEGEFVLALWRWHQPPQFDLPAEQLAAWREYPLVDTDLISKHELQATTDAQPLNIILVYLESVGQPLIDHPDWPGLMPELKALTEKYTFVRDFFASGYITLEGIVNSQCGTLFPFDRGGDTLTGNDNLADQMVCLGDVLSTAGYQLSYLGGANMAYAGKGAFLTAHGYHDLKGGEYWATQGIHQRPDTWGVSDADLFNQARNELARLRADGRPFNMTLLTIGTHLPGYSYEECEPYQDGQERFLNALHCTDQLLSRWLRDIEADGHLQDTLVVVTADHHIFPSPDMRRLFGEEATERRRLPLIVLDPRERRAPVTQGAAYDLAPTLLDLAGVQHNGRFALGRSLLRPENQRDYFFKRYADVLSGVEDQHLHGNCNPDTDTEMTLGIPLTSCQRDGMRKLLHNQIRTLSLGVTRLECDKPALTHAHLPLHEQEAIQLIVSGKDQSNRFVTSPMRVSPDSKGLYLARIEHTTDIIERRFFPPAELANMQEPPEVLERDAGWLLIWTGDKDTELPGWLKRAEAQTLTEIAGLWLARIIDGQVEWLNHAPDESQGAYWQLDKHLCDSLFNSDPAYVSRTATGR